MGTITSGGGSAGSLIAPQIVTDPVVLPRVRMTVRGLVMPGQTASNSVWYPRMTARQNLAATVAEAALKPQSDLTFTQVQSPVQTIAHWMRMSRFVLEDAPALQSTIDGELRYGLELIEEVQLLYGDGTGSNLLGLIPQASAYVAPFVPVGETAIDRILLAIVQSEQALLPATGIVLNFADWGKIRATKDGQGRYIIGDPMGTAPPMLWGLPVAVTPSISAGTFLVGSFYNAAQIFDRMSTEVLLSSEDQDNWVKNLVTARGEQRLAFCVKRPTAFITGTLP